MKKKPSSRNDDRESEITVHDATIRADDQLPASFRVDRQKQHHDSGATVMTEEHWMILWFMRDYRINNRKAADIKTIVEYLAEDLGYGARAKDRLFELFPISCAVDSCKSDKQPR